MDEEDALKRILRHHDAPLTRKLVEDLGAFVAWVHECEQLKASFATTRQHPPLLATELSKMGIYGREAINPVPTIEGGAAQEEWDREHLPA